MSKIVDLLLARNMIPDSFIRKNIRKRLKNKLKLEEILYHQLGSKKDQQLFEELITSPIAVIPIMN